VSENASATEPAALLAISIADNGVTLTDRSMPKSGAIVTVARVYRFGPLAVIDLEDDVPHPMPDAGEILLRVNAAGVGP
jgi:hypothetical protein